MNTGELYVVATPIGNLEDMTFRARHILQSVDLILAEDTRHSTKLLRHYEINTPVQAFHEHNEKNQLHKVLELLHEGRKIALISDAGTPLINDPGYQLVRTAHTENIHVIPVPGASAIIAALSVAGLPTDRFVFEGFLPPKSVARCKRLLELAGEQRTLVFLEVPHRIIATLEDMCDCLGEERQATLAKELTKQFECVRLDNLAGLLQWIQAESERTRGEFVLLLHGEKQQAGNNEEAQRILQILLETVSVKDASKIAARILGDNKNRLYQMALSMTEKTP